MMFKFFQFLLFFTVLISCVSHRNSNKTTSENKKIENLNHEVRNLKSNFSGKTSDKINTIIIDAKQLVGSPYRYGGTDSKGFDCSGLLYKLCKDHEIEIPRRSIDQSKQGREIEVKDIRPGDFLFFSTSGAHVVNHVGLVHTVTKDGDIIFIHSSTSKGVILSSLSQGYWNKAFLFAKRVL